MSGRLFRWALAWVALGLTSLQGAGRKPLAPEIVKLGYLSVPWESENAAPMIWGVVNRSRALLLLDTGFTHTTIDRSVALDIEPQPTEAARLMGPLLGPMEGTQWFIIRRLGLSRVQFPNVPARIMDLRIGKEGLTRQHGVLGADFLRRSQAIISCGDDHLLFQSNPAEPPVPAELDRLLREAGYTEVPMESLRLLVWVVPVRIGDSEFKMLVDTGAARTLLDADFAQQLHVKARGFSVHFSGVESREVKARRATVTDFQIGNFHAGDSKMMVGDTRPWNPAAQNSPALGLAAGWELMHGLLGFDFLKRHGAVIDCRQGKLWLRPAGK